MNASKFEETTWQGPDAEALELENPLFGYAVIAVALLAGVLSASVFGQSPTPKTTSNVPSQMQASEAKHSPGNSLDSANSDKGRGHRDRMTSRRWVLGARVKATGVGCLITEIVAGSAAAEARLAVGDRILAVDGKQCGWIGQRHISLFRLVDDAPTQTTRILVQRRATGRVSLLQLRLKTLPQTLGVR